MTLRFAEQDAKFDAHDARFSDGRLLLQFPAPAVDSDFDMLEFRR
ncbi:hypothetical protein HRUBRA_01084 [Pseudohaliea rubra DSM 19751]|uniref:Uncharacterized protein n=1 Tax=Pseudohaliea rubra DSM 19751 TaxID=1265313 RepID=A0A095VTI2_9GAMM|nr:hypothetical protein HRUBRA_01084 [Pseudohaliea rubra DSM 19751]